MEAHRSFRTAERLAPLAIISSVRFSAANSDSACHGVFGPCLDSDSAGGLRLGSGELLISIGRRAPQAYHARRSPRGAKTVSVFSTRSRRIYRYFSSKEELAAEVS